MKHSNKKEIIGNAKRSSKSNFPWNLKFITK